ncbi:hypothetical protein RUND412_008956 [Rhizina undulata]
MADSKPTDPPVSNAPEAPAAVAASPVKPTAMSGLSNLPGVTIAESSTPEPEKNVDAMEVEEEKVDDGLFGDGDEGGVVVEGEAEETKEREREDPEQDAEGEDEKEEDEELEKALEIYGRTMGYIDYLQSPIITILIGTPPSETKLFAHLALLQKSPYFVEECASFTFATPAADRQISLPDTELDPFGCFLQFLYTGEYTPRLVPAAHNPHELILEVDPDVTLEQQLDEDGTHLLKHAKVYTLADKFGIEELKELAHKKIHRINSTAKGELAYARYVYAHTSKEDKIREPIATFWAHRSHILRHEAEDDFRGMVLEFPQFAYDILSMVLDQKEKGKERERVHAREDRDTTELATPIQTEKLPTRTGSRKRPRLSTMA